MTLAAFERDDPRAYGARGDGGGDSTQAMQDALTAGSIHLRGGRYVLTGQVQVQVPSRRRITADPDAIVVMAGVDGTKVNTVPPADGVYRLFYLPDGTHDVTFERVAIEGQNDPFELPSGQHQASAIEVGLGANSHDIDVTGCTFRNLWGFSVHAQGGGRRINVTRSHFEDCGNGLNVNADWSDLSRNTMVNAEGIESSGAYIEVVGNRIDGANGTAAISIGGTTSEGAWRSGWSVAGNVIVDAAGRGISVNDGAVDGQVARNRVLRAGKQGIVVVGNTNAPTDNVIADNTIRSCGDGTSSTARGINLEYSAARTTVQGNRVYDGGDVGHDQRHGLLCYADDCDIVGNRLHGTFKDLALNGAAGVRLLGNRFRPTFYEAINGATLTADSQPTT